MNAQNFKPPYMCSTWYTRCWDGIDIYIQWTLAQPPPNEPKGSLIYPHVFLEVRCGSGMEMTHHDEVALHHKLANSSWLHKWSMLLVGERVIFQPWSLNMHLFIAFFILQSFNMCEVYFILQKWHMWLNQYIVPP